MKTNRKTILVIVIFLTAFVLSASLVSAQNTNQEKIPGSQPTSDFPTYVQQIVNFGFATIGILALFMLVIGAYQYLMAAGNIGKVDSAKETISSALFGLILGVCAWIILYKINPDLRKMELSGISGIGGGAGALPSVLGTTGNYPTAKSCSDTSLHSLANQYANGFASACRLMAYASAESSCNPQAGKNPTSSASTMFQVTDSTASDCGIAKGVSLAQDFQLAACVINMKYKSCANSSDPETCVQKGYYPNSDTDNQWQSRYSSAYSNCSTWGLASYQLPQQ